MLKNINILLIAFYLLTLSVPVYAGGLNPGSSHFTFNHNAFYRHKSRHTNQSYAKHKLKSHIKLHHKTKNKNKIIFPYHVYYPHYASYGIEEDNYVQIYVINDKKDEQIESSVNKDKTFSPPRIVNLEDVAPNKTKNVILIHGTQVIETKISSD